MQQGNPNDVLRVNESESKNGRFHYSRASFGGSIAHQSEHHHSTDFQRSAQKSSQHSIFQQQARVIVQTDPITDVEKHNQPPKLALKKQITFDKYQDSIKPMDQAALYRPALYSQLHSQQARRQPQIINPRSYSVKSQNSDEQPYAYIRNGIMAERPLNPTPKNYGARYVEDRKTSISVRSIEKNTALELVHFIGRRLKYYFQAARAAMRLALLIRPKARLWKQALKKIQHCKDHLQFNETVNAIKIKQWCQMVMTKLISLLNTKYQDCDLDLIESTQAYPQLHRDNQASELRNIFRLVLSSLELFTQQQYFLPELAMIMYSEQFFDQRTQFSSFVSKRTKYLSNNNKTISQEEVALIFTEAVIINQLIPCIIKLTENNKPIDVKLNNVAFILRCVISLLVYFFQKQFQSMPSVEMNQTIKVTQKQLGKTRSNGMVLLKTDFQDKEELIIGAFKPEQLQPIISDRWRDQMQGTFMQIVKNLIIYKHSLNVQQ